MGGIDEFREECKKAAAAIQSKIKRAKTTIGIGTTNVGIGTFIFGFNTMNLVGNPNPVSAAMTVYGLVELLFGIYCTSKGIEEMNPNAHRKAVKEKFEITDTEMDAVMDAVYKSSLAKENETEEQQQAGI